MTAPTEPRRLGLGDSCAPPSEQGAKPELRPGLPALALRMAWPNWIDEEGDELKFHPDGLSYDWVRMGEETFDPKSVHWFDVDQLPSESLAPIGRTWAEVEALAAGGGT